MATAVQDLLCQLSVHQLHASWSESRATWDLDSWLRPDDQRREDYLTLLTTARDMAAALDEVVDRFACYANEAGAGFAEIGTAMGVSRQAARQRHVRAIVLQPVTLVGGPCDGESTDVPVGKSAIQRPAVDPWLEDHPYVRNEVDPAEDAVYAIYRRDPAMHQTYRFQRDANPDGTPAPEPDDRLRIYRIADDCDIDSRIVLTCAPSFHPQLRSAAARLDPMMRPSTSRHRGGPEGAERVIRMGAGQYVIQRVITYPPTCQWWTVCVGDRRRRGAAVASRP